jgi:hypothetical protein
VVHLFRLEERDYLSVEIDHHVIRAGSYETGAAFVVAEMSLHGVVLSHLDRPRPDTSVSVEIRFAVDQDYDDEEYEAGDEDHPDGIPEGCDLGANYIGHVDVLLPSGEARPDLNLSVSPCLPLSVFPLLLAMKGTRLKLSTVHDSLVHPKVELNTYVAAFVKSVYFEPIPSQ